MAFQNQLQFNTSVPTYTENLAFRHHHPRALIIEKPHVQQAASAFVTRQNVSHVTRGRYLSAIDILTDLQKNSYMSKIKPDFDINNIKLILSPCHR